MRTFMETVQTTQVPEGGLGVFFLGQAGFLLKTPAGERIAIDPYLSNCCQRHFGFKRLMARLVEPAELKLDTLLISHAHYDHFDPDSVPELLTDNTALIGAKDVQAECDRLGLQGDITYLACGQTAQRGSLQVTAVACDHGELAPDAVGLLIRVGNKTVYYMGDTAYRPDLLENALLQNVDLLLLPINGAFGNLNEEQAARVVARLQPKLAVPCHFWNFAEHGGDPARFMEQMAKLAPQQAYCLMAQGEGMVLE